jgi:hypothetical protein
MWKLQVFSPIRRDHHHPSHHRQPLRGGTRFPSLPKYEGGHDTAEEERHSSPRWHEGHTKLIYEVHRTSRTYGGAARPTSPLNTIILFTSHALRYSDRFIIMMEEEKKLTHLEKRLVANVDFDDQVLQVLGFHTDIHYMSRHLGWVQFSKGVSIDGEIPST